MIARHVTMPQSGKMMMENGFLVGALPTVANSADYKMAPLRIISSKIIKPYKILKNKIW